MVGLAPISPDELRPWWHSWCNRCACRRQTRDLWRIGQGSRGSWVSSLIHCQTCCWHGRDAAVILTTQHNTHWLIDWLQSIQSAGRQCYDKFFSPILVCRRGGPPFAGGFALYIKHSARAAVLIGNHQTKYQLYPSFIDTAYTHS